MLQRSHRFTLFVALFVLSGAAGLIYEIVWSRMLVLVFGGTTFAISTVLSCFMGGLALGSHVAGRLISRVARPERVYGWLEIAIGCYCLLVPWLFDRVTPLYSLLVQRTGDSFVLLTAARGAVSAAILLAPTCMMGATLPILAQAFVRKRDGSGGRVAALYGFNTAGAFAGCVAAGFVLIPGAGLTGAIHLAAAINLTVGLIALLRSAPASSDGDDEAATPASAGAAPLGGAEAGADIQRRLLLALYFLSGFAAMAYQVAWTRALILALGSSTYAFSVIVACYILGLAVGSLAVSSAGSWPALQRLLEERTLWAAGWLQAAIALSALVVVPLVGKLPTWVAGLALDPRASFSSVLWAESLIVLGLLIVPTSCMGALLPLVCRLYAGRGGAGRSVGDVYASNTCGTIAGAFAAGFVLIPLEPIGMQRTIYLASAFSAASASSFLLAAARQRLRAAPAIGAIWALAIAAVALTAPWSREVMVSGPYLAPREPHSSVLYYREGVDTTVAVTSSGGSARSLRVNGKPDASNGFKDMVPQLMLAHIPMLLSPDAREVLVIGLGSGVTGGAVLTYPVRRLDIAEISEAVIEASAFFDELNNGVRRDPRATIRQVDGRNLLLLSDRRYDVIISEPSNPWISGVANLFTREFFELARGRLRQGGLHCQWLQGYSIEAGDVAAVVKTLAEVFEHVQFWETGYGDYLLIGSERAIEIDLERVYEIMGRPAVSRSLAHVLIQDPNQLAAYWIADRRELEAWIAPRPVLTDDRPQLEYSVSRFLLGSDEERIRQALLEFRLPPPLTAASSAPLAQEFLDAFERGRRRQQAMQRLVAAMQAKDGVATLDGLLDVARWGATDARARKRVATLLKSIEATPNPALDARVRETAARLRQDAPFPGEPEEAGVGEAARERWDWPFTRAFAHEGDPEVGRLETEIRQAVDAHDEGRVLELARRLVERAPDSWRGLTTLGVLLMEREQPELARAYLLRAWIRNPSAPAVSYRLAVAYARLGRTSLALDFLGHAIGNGLLRERLAADPELAPLRDLPEFQALLARES